MEMSKSFGSTVFSVGEYVVYGASGVCKIVGTEKKCFDGKNENTYYKMYPEGSESSVYYVPTDTDKLRTLMTKEQVKGLMDEIPAVEPIWSNNTNERKALFGSMLKSDDSKILVCLIKSLYMRKFNHDRCGKKLSAYDEGILRAAENMVFREFAAVLNTPPENIKDYFMGKVEDIPA